METCVLRPVVSHEDQIVPDSQDYSHTYVDNWLQMQVKLQFFFNIKTELYNFLLLSDPYVFLMLIIYVNIIRELNLGAELFLILRKN